MSYDLLDRPLVWIAVTWPGLAPSEDDGLATVVEHKIEVLVEIVDQDELKRLFFVEEEGGGKVSDMDVWRRLVTDWRGVTANKRPVPFVDENIEKMLRVPVFPNAFQVAYFDACNGKVKAREKNSEGSPSDGRAADPSSATSTATTSR